MKTPSLAAAHLHDIRRAFRNCKALGDKAMAQVSDEALTRLIDPDANSIAIVVKHVGGNLRSRFTDFLTADGEKPNRDRDGEFELGGTAPTRAEILAWWESGWAVALASIDALVPEDLERTVHIRSEEFLVVEALNRSISHTAYHVGEIVLLAKHFAGPAWTSLSIPKGHSAEFSHGTYKKGTIPPRPV